VGGEPSIDFVVAADIFAFAPAAFAPSQLVFANNVIGSIPTTGVNVVVLQTLDNDGNPGTAFGAGNAADLIAERITTSGPGLFIYFNSNLNLPRLVYSADLNVNTADLKILARMTNLTGNSAAMPTFTANNFVLTPEPSAYSLVGAAGVLWACARVVRRRRRQRD
jgi:hypothetical protein